MIDKKRHDKTRGDQTAFVPDTPPSTTYSGAGLSRALDPS